MLDAEETPKIRDSSKIAETFEDEAEESDTIRESQNWEDVNDLEEGEPKKPYLEATFGQSPERSEKSVLDLL